MNGLSIRALGAADVDAAVELAAGLREAPHWPRGTWAAMLEDGASGRVALGAFADGRLAGLAVASVTRPEAELESVAVAAEWQRQGVARALFEALAAGLRAAGADVVLLEVRESNAAARGLYAALGFGEAGRRWGYYADPAEDALILRRRLG